MGVGESLTRPLSDRELVESILSNEAIEETLPRQVAWFILTEVPKAGYRWPPEMMLPPLNNRVVLREGCYKDERQGRVLVRIIDILRTGLEADSTREGKFLGGWLGLSKGRPEQINMGFSEGCYKTEPLEEEFTQN